ncbi:VP2 protein [Pan troglodytes troglodytes polyomavirus 1]|uniref:VP2 protein n=2 Tax=Pan troglodytes troglodytes polyomavirus 1 TaxID=1236400 RepID=UPI00066C391D|nr:VP2 protein [Pan troglodytes troglodytes polyomavirus 1]AKP40988.1 VP2 protein [Pan troglodytes troglodytes polyomavirus 1]
MGAALALLGDLVATVSEAAAATGFSVAEIAAGEAAAAIEVQIASLATVEGITSTSEAIAAIGLSPQAYAVITGAPGAIAGLAAFIQTVSGVSSLAQVGYRFFSDWDHKVSTVGLYQQPGMALQLFNPEEYYDILFPGVNAFVNNIHYLDPRHWGPSLFSAISQAFWHVVRDDIPALTSREIQRRTERFFRDSLVRFLEDTTWTIVNAPINIYNSIENYYSNLSPIRPSMVRQVAEREGAQISFGHSYTHTIDDANSIQEVTERLDLQTKIHSGEFIEKTIAPGGANQRTAPQWMLPLLLGLYGTITPALEAYEDGPSQKKRRVSRGSSQKAKGSSQSSKATYKRRGRSFRS